MLKYFLVFSILFTTAFCEKRKVPTEVMKRIHIGSLITVNKLTNDPKYSDYYSSYVKPIKNGDIYYKDYYKVFYDLERYGAEYYTSKQVYGTYRGQLTAQEILILINLSVFEKLEKDFISLLKSVYVAKLDDVGFVDDEISASVGEHEIYWKMYKHEPLEVSENLTIKFIETDTNQFEVLGYPRIYVTMFKNVVRYLAKSYKFPQLNAEIIWKPTEEELLVSPLEIYASLISRKNSKNYCFFGDFSFEGKVRTWGAMRSKFEKIIKTNREAAVFPLDDLKDIKEYSLVFGKNLVINKQFIGVSTIEEVDELVNEKDLTWRAVNKYNHILEKVGKGEFKRDELLESLDEVLKIKPNHLSAQIYKELLLKKYPHRLSLMNSFFEFERIYFLYKNTDYFDYDSFADLDLESDISKLQKISHPKIIPLFKAITANILTAKQFKKETNKTIQKGLRQKVFKNLRLINQERDLLIDDQNIIDRVYVK